MGLPGLAVACCGVFEGILAGLSNSNDHPGIYIYI